MIGATRAPTRVRLGVIVPAHDELRTIEAKLEDLAACAWPPVAAGGAHVVVVADDHSTDGTGACVESFPARRARVFERLRAAGVELHVVASAAAPGKPGAVRAGLTALGALGFVGDDDVVILSDADVGFEPSALVHVAQAFELEPRLGMATGAQTYVSESLWGQGAATHACDAASDMRRYDRIFGWVRRCESRFGALLSVHGQLLAWRTSLALAPPDGRAADDLELVVAARDRPRPPRVCLLPGARFFERRARGAAEAAQATRRARAWFQHFGGPRPRRPALALQWRLWGLAPVVFLALTAPLAPFSRAIAARRRVLAEARRSERAAPMPARWEVARG